jgi:hypothetical protein
MQLHIPPTTYKAVPILAKSFRIFGKGREIALDYDHPYWEHKYSLILI